jgi:sulfatase modifying factor 1
MMSPKLQLRTNVSVLLVSLSIGSATYVLCSEQHVAMGSEQRSVQRASLVTNVPRSPCPENMQLVEGDYCTDVEQVCLRWVGSHGQPVAPPPPGTTGRCGEFKSPSKCVGTKVHKRFCIDTYEYPNRKGEIPQDWMTWYDVKGACESQGKRLCTKSEWTFACEGPEMHPYPYGDGYHRDRTSCNTDNDMPNGVDVFKATSSTAPTSVVLHSLLVPAGAKEKCVSPFGVHDQVGNIDEQVINESKHPYSSGLVGGHVFGVRNSCRPMTVAHNEDFEWYETGGRCCSSL